MNAILLKRVREREVQRQAILAEIAGLERKRYLGLLAAVTAPRHPVS